MQVSFKVQRSNTVRSSELDPSVALLWQHSWSLATTKRKSLISDHTHTFFLSPIQDELYHQSHISVKDVPLKEMNIMFVVDGSGLDQLETALEIVEGFSKRLSVSERHPVLHC